MIIWDLLIAGRYMSIKTRKNLKVSKYVWQHSMHLVNWNL